MSKFHILAISPRGTERQWFESEANTLQEAISNHLAMDEPGYIIAAMNEIGYNNLINRPQPFASILEEAAHVRGGDRKTDYGDAVENWENTAKLVSLITGIEMNASQCVKFMLGVKIAREMFKHKRDNLVDLCGYADILNIIEEAKQ